MPKVILDDAEVATYYDGERLRTISGAQIRARANKHRDPIPLSEAAIIGITEDDKPFLSWKKRDE